MTTANLPGHLQGFFTDRLMQQLGASPHTVASYRDTFRLLLRFASKRLKREPSQLRVEDLDVPLFGGFFENLERDRHNSVRTRNHRLCAVHAFFRYVCLNEPGLSLHCQRVLAIPPKRYERGPVEFLTADEASALLKAPDPTTWIGRRDRALLHVAVQTGLRNAEIGALRRQDVELGAGPHVRCLGKGRKKRCTPLRSDVVAILGQWFSEQRADPASPVFPTARGGFSSPDAIQRLVARQVRQAARVCRSLQSKKVTPHTPHRSHGASVPRRGYNGDCALARS